MKAYKDKIIAFYHREKRMPDYAEIMRLLGFKSKNAVFKLVQKLVEEGVVKKDAKGKLIPTHSLDEVPLLGLVEAGFPSAADQETLDTMSIDDYLIEHKEASYLLEVKGDSMIDAGIQEGDLVLAERRGEPKDGDIVIAEVDGGWTMKYYRKRAGKVYLEPANKKYKNIYPESDLRVAAIVRGVIRKY
ncbi:transcriptional repressor LexA [Candidatus Parcubacteria bacterium]|nr:transcriptional repressor LexA [Candidatus Parcubacteria bacterium]